MALMAWASSRSSFCVPDTEMRVSRWVALISSSLSARTESSSGDMPEAVFSLAAAAASSWMGLRVFLIVPAFLKRLASSEASWQIIRMRRPNTPRVTGCSRSRVMA